MLLYGNLLRFSVHAYYIYTALEHGVKGKLHAVDGINLRLGVAAHADAAVGLNPRDVLNADKVVFLEKALDKLNKA